ncbi:MAG: putative importin subunit beta-1 [Streblomastix strix]|uniref:Putative importin subunit beta-1 n=1 Tax=Streblomastix strix TaxID=222440 RepID=A0A5J4W2K7_9EUKA|nr:MAG: putative importin subunit beta-1 [Streblomastix strix]
MSQVREACAPAAQVISAIASIEIPIGKWDNIINILLGQIDQQQLLVKESILRCLGFICQDIPNSEYLEQHSNLILTAVVSGITNQESLQVRLAAMIALSNSLIFAKKNMDIQQERDYIMTVICQTIRNNEHEVKLHAYMCLILIAENYYRHLQPYMEEIYQITSAQLISAQQDGDSEEICLAIEFWSTICDREIDYKNQQIELWEKGCMEEEFKQNRSSKKAGPIRQAGPQKLQEV